MLTDRPRSQTLAQQSGFPSTSSISISCPVPLSKSWTWDRVRWPTRS